MFFQVYDIRTMDGKSLGIARVASPAFPVDKLLSEVEFQRFVTFLIPEYRLLQVATLRYLRTKTCIPVPEVYHFEQSASVIGAEYMLMAKVSRWTAFL